MINKVLSFVQEYISAIRMPRIRITDIVEILIISFMVYAIMGWVRKTKAWSLLKGMIVILGILLLAAIFNMSTILWLAEHGLSMLLLGIVVVLQPELRRAMEQLGQKNIFFSLMNSDSTRTHGRYSDHTIDEIVKASFAMGRVKTGALMVLERNETLMEYEKTGIAIDATVSSQLLINIFEHNTPLHDGAVIFRGDRIVAATCYLPLSDNRNLSKALGTRHRAGVGISEATDSMTVIVSEENGKVSVAYEGKLYSALTQEGLREKLELVQDKPQEEVKKKRKPWFGGQKGGNTDAEKADQ
ncbi:MAG: diadenylate cyclase CdaA [Lachnospiraceae bacterium]|nr:diadenylate cyclase CdaA [Lachnospiraceae bacterium]